MSEVSGSSTVGDDGQIAEDNDAATHSGEDAARQKAADNNTAVDEAVNDDPTGGTREQVAAKQAANAMGDQDEANTGYNPPAGAEVPTAQNVRRYPELFSQEVIDSFQVKDTPTEPVSEASDNGEVDSTTVASDTSNTSDTSSTSTSSTGTSGFISSGTE